MEGSASEGYLIRREQSGSLPGLKETVESNQLKNHAKLIHSELVKKKKKFPLNGQSFFDFDLHGQSLWKTPLAANTLFTYRSII